MKLAKVEPPDIKRFIGQLIALGLTAVAGRATLTATLHNAGHAGDGGTDETPGQSSRNGSPSDRPLAYA